MKRNIHIGDTWTMLQHARWHCLFGSELIDREPTQGDKDAADILLRLMRELSDRDYR